VKYSIEWLKVKNAVAEERATVGQLRLFLAGRNVTQHLLDGQVEDHVVVALYGLADGLVHDWWSIFGRRDRAFSLIKYRNGYLLPDIRLFFDGSVFEVAAHQLSYSDPDLRFWGGSTEIMDRTEGEELLGGLITQVIARLKSEGLEESSVEMRWDRVRRSLESDERIFCEAAGSLGLDPYQISDDAASFIDESNVFFSEEKLADFVAGAKDVNRDRILSWVRRMAESKGFRYRLKDLRPLSEELRGNNSPSASYAGYAQGYRYARAARRALHLGNEVRLLSFQDLAARLGAGKSYNLAPSVDGIRALRRDWRGDIDVHVRNHGDSSVAHAAHLFSLARAVGDALCFPSGGLAPINDVQSAYRQSVGRAFAAEFLAPVDEILSMRADGRDEATIASEFCVSTELIRRQIENKDRIAAACA
jgi:hypothetical protein